MLDTSWDGGEGRSYKCDRRCNAMSLGGSRRMGEIVILYCPGYRDPSRKAILRCTASMCEMMHDKLEIFDNIHGEI